MKASLLTLLISTTLIGCSVFVGDGNDRPSRTFGTVWDDQMIESKGRVRIKKAHEELREAHFNIVAYNGIVLLVGQVSSEEMRLLAAETLAGLQKVRKVYNELQVAGPTSIFSRANDSWLTTKIKTKMAAAKEVDASRIKVTTENGVVYLMGMVTEEESDAAVDLTRRVYGVQKVVKALEIIQWEDIPDSLRTTEDENIPSPTDNKEEEEVIESEELI
ncbi:MAG: BON domain-containing protein [Gammaproteobacteria bacterium]|nr:BON domain-containing protein [Gammaproteobacteria bacterium]